MLELVCVLIVLIIFQTLGLINCIFSIIDFTFTFCCHWEQTSHRKAQTEIEKNTHIFPKQFIVFFLWRSRKFRANGTLSNDTTHDKQRRNTFDNFRIFSFCWLLFGSTKPGAQKYAHAYTKHLCSFALPPM